MSEQSSNITDFIDNSVNDKPVKAFNAFSAEMETRVDAALQQKRAEVLQKVFNSVEVESQEEITTDEED